MAHRFWLLLLLGSVLPGLAQAARFDVIVIDELTFRVPLQDWGLASGGGPDLFMLVNTGTTPISAQELQDMVIRVDGLPVWPDTTTPQPNPRLFLGPNTWLFATAFAPLVPNEAVGNLTEWNALLTTQMGPGETLRDLQSPMIDYFFDGRGNSPGRTRFDIHIRIGQEEADFPMFLTLESGGPDYEMEATHASRFSSHSGSAPLCTQAVAEPAMLLSANRQFVPISIEGITDADGDPLTIVVTDVTQDEPVERTSGRPDSTSTTPAAVTSIARGTTTDRTALPQGNAAKICSDARIVDGRAEVRAERDNQGNGRVYALHFRAEDPQGNVCVGTVDVCVPRREAACVDDGQFYRSLDEVCPPGTRSELGGLVLAARSVGPREVELSFVLEEAGLIDLAVFDLAGRRLATLERGARGAGPVEARWNSPAAGVYFARLGIAQRVFSRAIVLR